MTVTVYGPGGTFATVKLADAVPKLIAHVEPSIRPLGEEMSQERSNGSKRMPVTVTNVPGAPDPGVIEAIDAAWAFGTRVMMKIIVTINRIASGFSERVTYTSHL